MFHAVAFFYKEEIWLLNGETKVYVGTDLCPCSVTGEIMKNNRWWKMKTINLGTGRSNNVSECKGTAACWHHHLKVIRVREGTDNRDYDYKFQKY